MRDIDRELETVEKAMASDSISVGRAPRQMLWPLLKPILIWVAIALIVLLVFQTVWG